MKTTLAPFEKTCGVKVIDGDAGSHPRTMPRSAHRKVFPALTWPQN